MFRRCIAFLLIATLNLVLVRSVHAETLAFLPSVVTPLPPSVFNAASVAGATMTADVLEPIDHSFLGQVARFLNGFRPAVSSHARDAAGRNPALRDAARERDATSFGIRSAPMNALGIAAAGAGAVSGAAQLVDLGNVANKIPVKLAPTVCQGGGGISVRIKTPW
jgi:hypothetical protein